LRELAKKSDESYQRDDEDADEDLSYDGHVLIHASRILQIVVLDESQFVGVVAWSASELHLQLWYGHLDLHLLLGQSTQLAS
jgi:hypothetical protein